MSKIKRGIIVAGLVTMGAALCTGCGKDKVDYNVGNGTGSETATGSDSLAEKDASSGSNTSGESGELRTKVNAPDSYEGEIPVGDSGLKSITIKADKIEVPDASTMSVIYCDRADGGADFKKNIVEKCFDTEKGLYVEDHRAVNKEDYDLQIESYQNDYDDAIAAGDDDYAKRTGDALEEYRTDAQKFGIVSDRVPLTDYSSLEERMDILGYRGDMLYSFEFGAPSSNFGIDVNMKVYPSQKLYSLRPLEDDNGISNVSLIEGDNEESGVDNKSEITAEEAQAVAEDFFDNIGYSDLQLYYCTDLYWNYYDYKGDTITEEADGYVVNFVRSANGTEVYNPYLWNIDYLSTTSGDISYLMTNEMFRAYIYDGQVVGVNMKVGMNKKDEESNVNLLQWDEVLKEAETAIPKYYGNLDNKTGYLDITFDEVKLTYYRVKVTEFDEDGNEILKGYKIIPAWAFICTEPGKNVDSTYVGLGDKDMYPFQLVVINAMDGSVVDLTHEVEY